MRTWTFWIRAADELECRAYLASGKLKEMLAASGNRRAGAFFRSREDGTIEVVVMSVWDSMQSVRAFIGDDHEALSIEPTDRLKIFDLEPKARHYAMSGVTSLALIPLEWRDTIQCRT